MTNQEMEALKAERDAMLAMLRRLEDAYLEWLSNDDYNVLVSAFDEIPPRCGKGEQE